MNKSQLVDIISEKFPYLKKNQITEMVEITLSSMVDSLKEGNRVEIRGFGSFSLRLRNVQTSFPDKNKTIELKPRKSIYFRLGKEFFDRLNNRPLSKLASIRKEQKTGLHKDFSTKSTCKSPTEVEF